jgi:hypothetical protein
VRRYAILKNGKRLRSTQTKKAALDWLADRTGMAPSWCAGCVGASQSDDCGGEWQIRAERAPSRRVRRK